MSARVSPGGRRVAIVHCPGYSGATWVGLLLASHPRALSIGPPNKVLSLPPERAGEACLVHGPQCTFWPPFIEAWDRTGDFFGQLAEFAGVDLIVTNNPRSPAAWSALARTSLELRHLRLLRDGRATLVSYMRHHYPGRPVGIVQAMREWLLPRWEECDARMPPEPGAGLRMRYEDFVADAARALARAGDFLGLVYPANAARYWLFEHHPVEGNSGTVDLLRRFQGLDGIWHHRGGYYARAFERLRRGEERQLLDESWKQVLSRPDRLAYDALAGERHERYGYERDRFTVDEVVAFLHANGLSPEPRAALVEALRLEDRVVHPEPAGEGDLVPEGSGGEGERPGAGWGGWRSALRRLAPGGRIR